MGESAALVSLGSAVITVHWLHWVCWLHWLGRGSPVGCQWFCACVCFPLLSRILSDCTAHPVSPCQWRPVATMPAAIRQRFEVRHGATAGRASGGDGRGRAKFTCRCRPSRRREALRGATRRLTRRRHQLGGERELTVGVPSERGVGKGAFVGVRPPSGGHVCYNVRV